MSITRPISECAELLGCTERWLLDHIRAGDFPAHKLSGHWRMTDDDIAAVMELCGVNTEKRTGHHSGLTAVSDHSL